MFTSRRQTCGTRAIGLGHRRHGVGRPPTAPRSVRPRRGSASESARVGVWSSATSTPRRRLTATRPRPPSLRPAATGPANGRRARPRARACSTRPKPPISDGTTPAGSKPTPSSSIRSRTPSPFVTTSRTRLRLRVPRRVHDRLARDADERLAGGVRHVDSRLERPLPRLLPQRSATSPTACASTSSERLVERPREGRDRAARVGEPPLCGRRDRPAARSSPLPASRARVARDEGELLGDAVVEIAGDPAPLVEAPPARRAPASSRGSRATAPSRSTVSQRSRKMSPDVDPVGVRRLEEQVVEPAERGEDGGDRDQRRNSSPVRRRRRARTRSRRARTPHGDGLRDRKRRGRGGRPASAGRGRLSALPAARRGASRRRPR